MGICGPRTHERIWLWRCGVEEVGVPYRLHYGNDAEPHKKCSEILKGGG